MASCGTFKKLRPLGLLTHLSNSYDTARLQVSNSAVSWSIYLEQGKITYASHSVEPFDRLDRHLRRFGYQIPTLVNETRAQLRLIFEAAPESHSIQNADYQALCWLVSQQYLNSGQVAVLIEELVKEVIESFLLLKEGTYQFENKRDTLPEFCRLELQPIVEHCQKQLQGWQALGPQIWSPYQRPYFSSRTRAQQQLLPEIGQKLSSMLKGSSFYHLAVLLNQDELQLAQSLHPYIVDGTILLHDPHPPFEQLPKTFEQLSDTTRPPEKFPSKTQQGDLMLDPTVYKTSTPLDTKSTYTIVCVDDNLATLREMNSYLDHESLSVFPINAPVEALMQIITLKPDLILLNFKMPTISGYELCYLIRSHPLFSNKPIIVVMKNPGIIDRLKARFVGASGCLKEPFTKVELLKMVFKNLAW